jgi:murein DD-endopeptidase MepM/ murein hydrolase activator NlpD
MAAGVTSRVVRHARGFSPAFRIQQMPKLVLSTSTGFAGRAFIVAAIGTACTAWLMHEAPTQSADVSLHASDDIPAHATRDGASAASSDSTAQSAQTAATTPPAEPAYRVETAQVTHSFSEAASKLGVDAATAAQLARALAGRLDFRRDLQPGSEVRFVFRNDNASADANAQVSTPATTQANKQANTQTNAPAASQSADTVANADDDLPLAVRISTGKTSHDLFLYRNLDGKAFYYGADGQSNAPSFARYPLAYTRVSSAFSPNRLDPVTHRWAAHDGVDLAAPAGTPVHATARGTVTFAGWETGYGRVIKIKNFGDYSTTFAHLSRFAKSLRAGAQVHKGQVIGYVGSTGWATGPHLHYEVHVDHVPKNPLTVALPQRAGMSAEEKEHFAQQVAQFEPML